VFQSVIYVGYSNEAERREGEHEEKIKAAVLNPDAVETISVEGLTECEARLLEAILLSLFSKSYEGKRVVFEMTVSFPDLRLGDGIRPLVNNNWMIGAATFHNGPKLGAAGREYATTLRSTGMRMVTAVLKERGVREFVLCSERPVNTVERLVHVDRRHSRVVDAGQGRESVSLQGEGDRC